MYTRTNDRTATNNQNYLYRLFAGIIIHFIIIKFYNYLYSYKFLIEIVTQ